MDRKEITRKWHQCCYTNVSHREGDVMETGWNSVAVSDNIPPSAYKQCKHYQAAHSQDPNQMLDEDGNILNLLEMEGDGTYLYIIRTQYGLQDASGRPNMFSHAYIFPCKGADDISNPNLFLTIANENFTSNEIGAEEIRNKEELVRNPDFSIEGVLDHCRLTVELYLTLIRCVYSQICVKSTNKPLYIQYDGGDEQIRELLYLIYSALPLSARRRLSFLSCPRDRSKVNIVFSKNARKQKRYLVPKTGENSILSEAEKKRFFKLGYIEHAVSICRHGDMGKYYQNLEQTARRLGDTSASKPEILRIAAKINAGQKPTALKEKELTELLMDVLQANVTGDAGLTLIVQTAREFDSRGYEPKNKMKALLIDYADHTQDKTLLGIIEKYRESEDIADTDLSEEISLEGQEELDPDCAENLSEEKAEPVGKTELLELGSMIPMELEHTEEIVDIVKSEYELQPKEMVRPQCTEGMMETKSISLPEKTIEAKHIEDFTNSGALSMNIKIFSGQQPIYNKFVDNTDEFIHILSQEYLKELSSVIPELAPVCSKALSDVTNEKGQFFAKIVKKFGINI